MPAPSSRRPTQPKPTAPVVEGLVATRVTSTTWQGRPGRCWDYHAPADCRPLGRRVHVHVWAAGDGSYVEAIEGDGRRPDFRRLERIEVPVGAGDAEIVAAAARLAGRHLSLASPNVVDPERTIAGMLTAAGFLLDDFMGSEAWIRPNESGYTCFIRPEPEPRAVRGRDGSTLVAPLPVPFSDPEAPVEVGVMHDTDLGMVTTVAPSLEEAIEVADSDRLPLPEGRQQIQVDFRLLFGAPGVDHPG